MRTQLGFGVIVVGLVTAGCGTETQPREHAAMRPVLNVPVVEVAEKSYPSYVTAEDIMTREDAFFHHHLSPLTEGTSFDEWPLVKNLSAFGNATLRRTVACTVGCQFDLYLGSTTGEADPRYNRRML